MTPRRLGELIAAALRRPPPRPPLDAADVRARVRAAALELRRHRYPPPKPPTR